VPASDRSARDSHILERRQNDDDDGDSDGDNGTMSLADAPSF